jgi:hypothetical protein
MSPTFKPDRSMPFNVDANFLVRRTRIIFSELMLAEMMNAVEMAGDGHRACNDRIHLDVGEGRGYARGSATSSEPSFGRRSCGVWTLLHAAMAPSCSRMNPAAAAIPMMRFMRLRRCETAATALPPKNP